MPKYNLHVLVYGNLDIIVNAENEKEVIDMYLKQREELLKYKGGTLQDDLDASYIVCVNSKLEC